MRPLFSASIFPLHAAGVGSPVSPLLGEPLARHPQGQQPHLLHGVQLAGIVASSKLIHIPKQVLHAHLVVGADIAPLEYRPKRFNPVGVDHAVDVLFGTVADALPILYPVIAAVFIGVDLGPRGRVRGHKPAQHQPVGVVDHRRLDRVRLRVGLSKAAGDWQPKRNEKG